MIKMVAAPRARSFGFALFAALPLLSGCASVVPAADNGRPATATPAPPPRAGTPRPYTPRPSEGAGAAAQPIPATARAPLPAPAAPADATTAAASGVIAGPEFSALGVTAQQAT
ncbi:MAG: hypothetical protein H2055_12555, partial [Sphingopyxis sp.]|nr:hypothetical protein [Sphingopyxis sp.]